MAPASERAVSEVIGAILIFAFLVITFSIYQGMIVPQQNRAIEFNHNQAVQDSIQDLRNAVRQTATTGSEESVSITLGATYPERVLAINPGISAGNLQTEALGSITVRNVTATDREAADYFGNTTTTLGGFGSKSLVFRPVYTHYGQAPDTRYENTLAYNAFPGGVNLTITDQALVDGRKLTLIALDGNVSAARRGSVTVDTQGASTATRAVSVTNDSGPINVTIPTRLTAQNWSEILEDELDPGGTDPNRFVTAVKQTGPNRVSLILEPGVTYELRIAKVGVGGGTTTEDAKYAIDVEGDNTSVIENGTQKLVVEVRDRFNNPVSNVTVSATIATAANATDPREAVTPASATTGADGRATFTYAAPEEVAGAQGAEVEARFTGDGTANESVTFDVRVLDADGSGGATGGDSGDGTEDINPSQTGEVVLLNASQLSPAQDHVARLFFNNTAGEARTIDEVRISFYYPDQGGVEAQDATIGGTTFPVGGSFTPVTGSLADGVDSLDVTFDPTSVEADGDFFILSIRFAEEPGTNTYFVSVQGGGRGPPWGRGRGA